MFPNPRLWKKETNMAVTSRVTHKTSLICRCKKTLEFDAQCFTLQEQPCRFKGKHGHTLQDVCMYAKDTSAMYKENRV